MQGPTGNSGQTGVIGSVGNIGNNGLNGMQGDPGFQGLTGLHGSQFINATIFTGAGNYMYSKPTNASSLFIRVWGAGGAGGGLDGTIISQTFAVSGGGGGGSYVEGWIQNPNNLYSLIVGQGGQGTLASGENGNASHFGSLFIANGGEGGTVQQNTIQPGGGLSVVAGGGRGGIPLLISNGGLGLSGTNGSIGYSKLTNNQGVVTQFLFGGLGGSSGGGGNGNVSAQTIGYSVNGVIIAPNNPSPGLSPGGGGNGAIFGSSFPTTEMQIVGGNGGDGQITIIAFS